MATPPSLASRPRTRDGKSVAPSDSVSPFRPTTPSTMRRAPVNFPLRPDRSAALFALVASLSYGTHAIAQHQPHGRYGSAGPSNVNTNVGRDIPSFNPGFTPNNFGP